MGAAGPASFSQQECLYFYVRTGQLNKVREVIAAREGLVNQPLTVDCRSPALLVAVRTDNPPMVALMLQLGADPAGLDRRKRDAFMAAAHLDCHKSLDYLIDNLSIPNDRVSIDGLSAMDYSIVRGNMHSALRLAPHFGKAKDPAFYAQYAEQNRFRYVNYTSFIRCLMEHKVEGCPSCDFRLHPPASPATPNLRESWGSFINKVPDLKDSIAQHSEFSDPEREHHPSPGLAHLLDKLSRLKSIRQLKEERMERAASSASYRIVIN